MLSCWAKREEAFHSHAAYTPQDERWDESEDPCGLCYLCLVDDEPAHSRPTIDGREPCTSFYSGDGCDLAEECPYYHY